MNEPTLGERDEAALAAAEPRSHHLRPPIDPSEEILEAADVLRALDETHLQWNTRADLRGWAPHQIPLEERDRLPGHERAQTSAERRAEDRPRSGVDPHEPESVQVDVESGKGRVVEDRISSRAIADRAPLWPNSRGARRGVSRCGRPAAGIAAPGGRESRLGDIISPAPRLLETAAEHAPGRDERSPPLLAFTGSLRIPFRPRPARSLLLSRRQHTPRQASPQEQAQQDRAAEQSPFTFHWTIGSPHATASPAGWHRSGTRRTAPRSPPAAQCVSIGHQRRTRRQAR